MRFFVLIAVLVVLCTCQDTQEDEMFQRLRALVRGEDFHGSILAGNGRVRHEKLTARQKIRQERQRIRRLKKKEREDRRVARALRRELARQKRRERRRRKRWASRRRSIISRRDQFIMRRRRRLSNRRKSLQRRLRRERRRKAAKKRSRQSRWRRRQIAARRRKKQAAAKRFRDREREKRKRRREREFYRTATMTPRTTKKPAATKIAGDMLPRRLNPLSMAARHKIQVMMAKRRALRNSAEPPSPGVQDGTGPRARARAGSLSGGVPAIEYPWWYYFLVVVPFVIFCPIFIAVLCCWSPEKTDGYLLMREGASTEEVHKTSNRYKALILLAIAVVFVAATLALGLGLFLSYVPGGAPTGSGATRAVRISGGTTAVSDQLERMATSMVKEMDGDVVWKTAASGIAACPAPRSCGGDGKNHYGVMYSAFCGYTRFTACASAKAPKSGAVRGSVILHEAMHMYMARLNQHGKGKEILDYTKLTSSYFNEPFTDCLTQALGGKWMHYGCSSGTRLIQARQLLQKYPPQNYPWLPPLGRNVGPLTPQSPNPPSTGSRIVSIKPARLLDTREGDARPLGARRAYSLKVTGRAGIPDSATGVILNIVAVKPLGNGFLTVFPTGAKPPLASSLNYRTGDVVAASVFARVGSGGRVDIYSLAQSHIVVDVSSYQSTSAGHYMVPVNPVRVHGSSFRAKQSKTIRLAGVKGIPTEATSVVMSVRASGATRNGFLTIYPGRCVATPPLVSSVNYRPGEAVSNMVIAPLSGGLICVYSLAPVSVHLDVTAYSRASKSTVYFPITPQRIVDTRTGSGQKTIKGRVISGKALKVAFAGTSAPSTTKAVALTVTVVKPNVGGYVTVYPCGMARPNTVTVSFGAGAVKPAPAFIKLNSRRELCFYSTATTDLVIDLNGYST